MTHNFIWVKVLMTVRTSFSSSAAISTLKPFFTYVRKEQNLLIDRDLAWLEFNRRVLKEVEDPPVPLLEQVKEHAGSSKSMASSSTATFHAEC